MHHLILGGTRSGKSDYAEKLARSSQKEVIYIATGTAGDAEMKARIDAHKSNRPQHWQTIEEPILLADTLERYANSRHCLLVDCLTLWLTNILFDAQGNYQEDIFLQQKQALLNELPYIQSDIIFVSNEVGTGVIPMDSMSRLFVDEAGKLHQQLAKLCSQVSVVTAGIAQTIKQ